jgi:tetratricopeptide (TPR) repeat protein/transcriptional regulator with XRE-family HTH domain
MSLANASHDALPKHPNTLLEWIKRRHYKVKALADKTDIPIRTLWDYIAGRVPIPEYRLERLAECLSCRPEQLLSTLFLWNVPHQRNPYFTGREALLQQIHEALNKKHAMMQAYALCGLGGIGKTQTVLEYSYRYYDEYQAIFWVKADTYENLMSDFLSLAILLNLSERDAQDQAVTLAAIKRWLREHEAWLLFLLRRASLVPPDGTLEAVSDVHLDIAVEIVRELGGLPLALDQAGAYIDEVSSSLHEYAMLFYKQRNALLKRRGGLTTDHPEPVATTWSLSFERVEQTDTVAADVLRLCAFLDPDAIPEEIFTEGASKACQSLSSLTSNVLRLHQAIEVLRKFSLIHRNPDTKILTIHRLVQANIQDAMDQEAPRLWTERAILAVNGTFPAEVTVTLWPQCQRLLPHVQMIAILTDLYKLDLLEAATLFNQAGYYLRERALYTEAESLYQRALAIREQVCGSWHPDTAQVIYNLARLHFDLGQYAVCEGLYQQALAIRERTLPPNDLSIALSLNSLAFMYYVWGVRYDEAEKLFERALPIFDQAIGVDHPKTSHCLSNLALLYATQGKYSEAENLLLRVQAIRDKSLGPTHLDTARSLQNLAWLYIEQGKQEKYEQAKRLLEQSLEIREYLLGSEHPQTAISLHHLALLCDAQEKYGEADQLYQRVLAIRRKMMGKDNPRVLLTEKHYATLLRKMGRREEAVQLEVHRTTDSFSYAYCYSPITPQL